jgi:hypothetical protein
MPDDAMLLRNRWAFAWGALTAAFAIHVLDEATHDFLTWYNPVALAVRERLGGLPFPPVFSYPVWLTALCTAVCLLAAMTPMIQPRRHWAVFAAYAYGIVHVANALAHLTVSVAGRRLAPGVLSSPLLLLSAGWLLYETRRVQLARRNRIV